MSYVYNRIMILIIIITFLIFNISVPLTTCSPINVSLGFLTPLDESLGPLSTLGKELVSQATCYNRGLWAVVGVGRVSKTSTLNF